MIGATVNTYKRPKSATVNTYKRPKSATVNTWITFDCHRVIPLFFADMRARGLEV